MSHAEARCLERSPHPTQYPPERMRVFQVENFPALGRLAALRFLEWVQQNPQGVISLPTGKTPEYFIRFVKHFLEHWDEAELPGAMPSLGKLHLVQMDEFFPIDSSRHNSFCNYVRKYYIDGFGLDPERALLIDCNAIGLDASPTEVQAWCDTYESRIQSVGGIGFFLGGIGPDGHIAFNIRGSAHDSRTRLTETNYETQAAAATDLGGIEVARATPVITIGLGTITQNPDCTAIIFAAGEAKAQIIADAIEHDPDPQYPATVLQRLPNAAFYLTDGAASRLQHRRPESPEPTVQALAKRIEAGLQAQSGMTFLHTEPHHDDIMLAYQPTLQRDLHDSSTKHVFATLTSGFTAVSNDCLRERVLQTGNLLNHGRSEEQLSPDDEVHAYIDGLVASDENAISRAQATRFARNMTDVLGAATAKEIDWILDYLDKAYPGQKDIPEIQTLKGAIREWEIETLWGSFGVPTAQVHHLRLGFYNGGTFTEAPTESRDVPPVIELIQQVKPDVLTVAFDPEASGPDTHYKVLQAIAAALRVLKDDGGALPSRIWGYRNVWYRFHSMEVDLIIPVSRDELAVMHRLFMEMFVTQRNASFPSHEHDGPFSELAQRVQVQQYHELYEVLGQDWFRQHENPRVRAACAAVFIREMSVDEFLNQARDIRKQVEAL